MGRSNMGSLKITLLPLAISLLLSLNSQVSGKPSPKYFLIDTKEKAKKNSDYVNHINDPGSQIHSIPQHSDNFDYTGAKDYVSFINNGGVLKTIPQNSVNVDYTGTKDYVSNINNGGIFKTEGCINYDHDYIGAINNAPGGAIYTVVDGSLNVGK